MLLYSTIQKNCAIQNCMALLELSIGEEVLDLQVKDVDVVPVRPEDGEIKCHGNVHEVQTCT